MTLTHVDFPERLANLRKQRGLTQTALATIIGIHHSQLRRYENGTAQPTLDVIRRLTTALNTTSDNLIFNTTPQPEHHDWQLRLEAITQLDPDEQQALRTVIDGILIRHQARKLAS